MKFSVVIPAHNGLALVKDACYSVLEQLPADGELIVFDNASKDDFRAYAKSVRDSRVRFIHSERFLPVTDSWNTALNAATGEYVFFLGNDDGLAPACFDLVSELIERFDGPEAIYGALYQFFHPGVAPWQPEGYVKEMQYAFFFRDAKEPFFLSRTDARGAVLGSLNFLRNFTFNSQAFVLHKNLLKRLRGPSGVFQSPFPDYYLSNVILAKSRSTVVSPRPFSIAGVSKGSFGYMLFNGLEAQGEEYLNTDILEDPIYRKVSDRLLPEFTYTTKYALTMEYVARDTAEEIGGSVGWSRYRRYQVFSFLQRSGGRNLLRTEPGLELWNRLSVWEKIFTLHLMAAFRLSKVSQTTKRFFDSTVARWLSPYRAKPSERILDTGSFTSLHELFDALRDGRLHYEGAARVDKSQAVAPD